MRLAKCLWWPYWVKYVVLVIKNKTKLANIQSKLRFLRENIADCSLTRVWLMDWLIKQTSVCFTFWLCDRLYTNNIPVDQQKWKTCHLYLLSGSALHTKYFYMREKNVCLGLYLPSTNSFLDLQEAYNCLDALHRFYQNAQYNLSNQYKNTPWKPF